MDYQALFAELTRNIDWTEGVELVPVAELWHLREFDRRAEPKADQTESDETIEELKAVLQGAGLRNPLSIDYFPATRRVLLTEGNHRLAAACELGMMFLPVKVRRSNLDTPEGARPVKGVEPDRHGYVRGDLTPSMVGIRGCVGREGTVLGEALRTLRHLRPFQ